MIRVSDLSPRLQKQMFPGGKKPKVNRGEEAFALQCRQFQLPPFREQYYFAKSIGRKYTADFAFLEFDLLIEIQGGIWTRGAHGHPTGLKSDIEKQQHVAFLNFVMLPFTPDQILESRFAIEWTIRVLKQLGWKQ